MKLGSVIARVVIVPLLSVTFVACSSGSHDATTTTNTATGASSSNTPEETANLAVVQGFFKALVTDKSAAEVGKYLSDDFVSHSPDIDGKKGMMDFATYQATNYPHAAIVDVIHTIATGDLVIMHYTFANDPSKGPNYLIVDFFRVKDGLIVEYWDVLQTLTTSG